jgi:hypothetical protein
MELDIHEGKRVLYKHNGQWEVGELTEAHNTKLTNKGLYLSIIPKEFIGQDASYLHDAEINDIFLDATPIEDYWRDYKDIFMTKEEYIKFIESEDFVKASEQAYVSDGEYYYYPISKYNKNWIEKQPFEYVVRMV